MQNKPQITKANLFHIGSTCPFCQETISEGQNIVICEKCASIQHEMCWEHNNGCASYSCDAKVRIEGNAARSPDIVINVSELDKAIIPPVIKGSREERAAAAARAFAPIKPEKRSVLAIISACIAGISVTGFAGLLSEENPQIFFVGAALAIIAAILTGIIALVKINVNKRLSGGLTAGLSVLFSCIMLVMYMLFLYKCSMKYSFEKSVSLKLSEIPDEQQIEKLDPAKANALKANTVVQCMKGKSLFGDISLGSGVITKIKDNRAYIITNRHVIGMIGQSDINKAKDTKIKVIMYNREESEAKIEWLAPHDVDIAIISCPALTIKQYIPIHLLATSLPPSSKSFAVGNPMNLLWSYTEGIISSIRKKDLGHNDFLEIYQTQTPINQGNSGGGLYSMDGQLIGINTWLHNKSVSEGLNFAISTVSILKLLGKDADKYLTTEKTDEGK